MRHQIVHRFSDFNRLWECLCKFDRLYIEEGIEFSRRIFAESEGYKLVYKVEGEKTKKEPH